MTDRYDSGREYFEWVELSQSFCENRFGDGVESSAATGACMATLAAPGDEKCHNTLSTCARVDNYAEGALVLRFCRDGVRMPRDGEYYFPLLTSARIIPASINPGSGNRDKGALGTRAQLSATFRDGPHPDTIVDPYLAERLIGAAQYDGVGYNPFTRSTFWRKWAARNLYKLNRKIVHCGGYIDADGVVSDVVRREFWVSGFTGPNNDGGVTIEGQDILARIADEKAQIPAPSNGKLDAGIDDNDGSATLTPSGIGDDEYPASGWVCIDDEVIAFTRSGDALTLTARGEWGTVAASHAAGSTVQLGEHFDAVTPSEILQRAIAAAGIDVSEYCDLAQWADETYTFLPRLYSTLIPRPVGAYQIVGEVQECMFLYVWLDERDNLIKLRAVRPAADETITSLDENSIESLVSKEQPEQRLSRVVVNYALIDYAKGLGEPTNYSVTDIVGAFEEETAERSGGALTRVINTRWLDATDGAAAVELGERLLARYKIPPRRVTFKLDAKDRDLWVGDFVSVTTAQHVDRFGLPVPLSLQVLSVTEDVPGHRFAYEAQQFVFIGAESPWSVEIATDIDDVNLRDLYDAKYATPPFAGQSVSFTVRSGAVVGSSSTATPAMQTGDWPEGVGLSLTILGVIAGRGGRGGSPASTALDGPAVDTAATAGGDALHVTVPITVDNQGVIGGGGGGGSLFVATDLLAPFATYWAGGGGAGGGSDGWVTHYPGGTAGREGSAAGTLYAGGDALSASYPYPGFTWPPGKPSYVAPDMRGGDLGQAAPGAVFVWNYGPYVWYFEQYAGAVAGNAVVGDSYITWIATGDRRGNVA